MSIFCRHIENSVQLAFSQWWNVLIICSNPLVRPQLAPNNSHFATNTAASKLVDLLGHFQTTETITFCYGSLKGDTRGLYFRLKLWALVWLTDRKYSTVKSFQILVRSQLSTIAEYPSSESFISNQQGALKPIKMVVFLDKSTLLSLALIWNKIEEVHLND